MFNELPLNFFEETMTTEDPQVNKPRSSQINKTTNEELSA